MLAREIICNSVIGFILKRNALSASVLVCLISPYHQLIKMEQNLNRFVHAKLNPFKEKIQPYSFSFNVSITNISLSACPSLPASANCDTEMKKSSSILSS